MDGRDARRSGGGEWAGEEGAHLRNRVLRALLCVQVPSGFCLGASAPASASAPSAPILLPAAPEAAAATCNSHSEQGGSTVPSSDPHPLMMTSAPDAAGNNKGQQSRRRGAAEGSGWTGRMTRRSGGRGVGRRGRRTSKVQGAEGVVVCPGAVGVLPGGQCIRQRLGSLVSDPVACSAGSSSSNTQQPQ